MYIRIFDYTYIYKFKMVYTVKIYHEIYKKVKTIITFVIIVFM